MSTEEFNKLYDDYYSDGAQDIKRELAAMEQLAHFDILIGNKIFDSIIDVGAGQGSLLALIAKLQRAKRIVAAEISQSGLCAIADRKLRNVEAVSFDGYNLPFANKEFDVAICMHVLEHVGSERQFLREVARVSRFAVIEVPLEHTIRIRRAIKVSRKYGHINYYTTAIFLNLLETANMKVNRYLVSAASLDMERHLYGDLRGSLRRGLRQGLLSIVPKIAPALMVYNCTALVDCGE